MTYGIDEILSMLSWDRPKEEQVKGIVLAKDVKCINAFLQPGPPYGKPVWDNCAIVLSKKSNEELEPYIYFLMLWLQDINWPGSIIIYQRLLECVSKLLTLHFRHLFRHFCVDSPRFTPVNLRFVALKWRKICSNLHITHFRNTL